MPYSCVRSVVRFLPTLGKTRLLQELRLTAVRHGTQVGYGRCYSEISMLLNFGHSGVDPLQIR